MDSDLPLFDITTIEEYLHSDMWPLRVIGTLFTAFAVMALVMSSIGLYGITAYGVTQRTQEIGVRMALGGSSFRVGGLVLRQALKPIVMGLAIGLLGSMFMSSLPNFSIR